MGGSMYYVVLYFDPVLVYGWMPVFLRRPVSTEPILI